MAKSAESTRETDQVEAAALERFIAFLGRTRGVVYWQSGREVPVNDRGTNYDYELSADTPGVPPLAVEIFRLVESEETVAADKLHARYWVALKEALAAARVAGVVVQIPPRCDFLPRETKRRAKQDAAEIKSALVANPNAAELKTGQFTIRRLPELSFAALGSTTHADWVDGVGTATAQLVRNPDLLTYPGAPTAGSERPGGHGCAPIPVRFHRDGVRFRGAPSLAGAVAVEVWGAHQYLSGSKAAACASAALLRS